MPLDQADVEDPELERNDRDLARMPLTDHIEDLRYRLILAMLGPAVAMVGTLAFGWELVAWLLRPLLQVLDILGLPPQTYAFGVPTGFAVYVKVSLVAAIIIAFPWLCFQLWKFVESGLYAFERKAIYLIAPFSALMSILGVLFLYYLLLPASLAFMIYFTTSFPAVDVGGQNERPGLLQLVTQITISSYSPSAPDLDGGAPGEGSAEDNGTAGETGTDQGSAQAGSADTPPGHIAILEQNPAEPVDGQAWVKVPERELRIHLGEQTYRFLPFQNRSMVQPMMDVNQYLGFVTFLALGVVIAFQLPVVMLILGWSGLVSPRWLAQYRKYCIFGCFVLGTLFTPADPISMLMLAMPLWGLFELGILLMRLTYRPSPTFDDMGWD